MSDYLNVNDCIIFWHVFCHKCIKYTHTCWQSCVERFFYSITENNSFYFPIGGLMLNDKLNHVSLIRGARLSKTVIRTFNHNDMYLISLEKDRDD